MAESFVVELPERIDVPASLEIFRRPGDDLIDRWDGRRLLRTVPTGTGSVPYKATVLPDGEASRLEVTIDSAADRELVERAVMRSFAIAPAELADLLSADQVLRDLHSRFPGIRPVLQHNLFAALVRSISAQQINLRWAATTRARLATRFGDQHLIDGEIVYSLNPERLAVARTEDIRALQFTVRKAESIIGLAREVASGRLDLLTLSRQPDDEVIARLVQLRGIGVWSAEWILCRSLGRPRVVAGDLGVRKAVGQAYLEGAIPTEEETRRLTEHWGHSGSVAQALLLHAYAAGAT